jgi:hypothetical protein
MSSPRFEVLTAVWLKIHFLGHDLAMDMKGITTLETSVVM